MMMGNVLLAVDFTQVLTALVPIVFFVIYVINQLLTGKGNPQQQNPQQPGRKPQRRPAQQQPERAMRRPQQPQGKPQGDSSQLNAEIEKFLKRAGQRRSERSMPERAAGASAATKASPAPMEEQPIDVAPIEGEISSVAGSVDAHLGNRGFGEHLAKEVAQADEQMERHLHEAFDHRVGSLKRKAGGEAGAQTEQEIETPATAAALAELLRTPQGMRQAIVLSEILARPEHRW